MRCRRSPKDEPQVSAPSPQLPAFPMARKQSNSLIGINEGRGKTVKKSQTIIMLKKLKEYPKHEEVFARKQTYF